MMIGKRQRKRRGTGVQFSSRSGAFTLVKKMAPFVPGFPCAYVNRQWLPTADFG
jgi:hypothetical protein